MKNHKPYNPDQNFFLAPDLDLTLWQIDIKQHSKEFCPEEDKKVIFFHVTFESAFACFSLKRRYSEFHTFYKYIQKAHSRILNSSFPKKSLVKTSRVIAKRKTKLAQFLTEIFPHLKIMRHSKVEEFFALNAADRELSEETYGDRFTKSLKGVSTSSYAVFLMILGWTQSEFVRAEGEKKRRRKDVLWELQKIQTTKSQVDIKQSSEFYQRNPFNRLRGQVSVNSLNKRQISEIQSEMDLNKKIKENKTPSYFKWGTNLSRSSDLYTQDSQKSNQQRDFETNDSFSSKNSDIDFFNIKDEKHNLKASQNKISLQPRQINLKNMSNSISFKSSHGLLKMMNKHIFSEEKKRENGEENVIESNRKYTSFENNSIPEINPIKENVSDLIIRNSIKSEYIFKRNDSLPKVFGEYFKRNSANFNQQALDLFSQNDYFLKCYCQLILSCDYKDFESNFEEIKSCLKIEEIKPETLGILIKGYEKIPSLFQLFVHLQSSRKSILEDENLLTKIGLKKCSNKKHKLSQILEEEIISKCVHVNKAKKSIGSQEKNKHEINFLYKKSWSKNNQNYTLKDLKFIQNVSEKKQSENKIQLKSVTVINFLIEIFVLFKENQNDLELTALKNKVLL